MFYGTSFFLMLLISTHYLPTLVRFRRGVVFGIFLLLNNFLLSWVVYPMNKDPLVWDRQKIDGIPLAQSFKPTDRLTRVSPPKCNQTFDYAKCVETKFFSKDHGAHRLVNGHSLGPGLRLSGTKSFTQTEVADFIKTFMAIEHVPTKSLLRTITSGNLPVTSSRLFNIGATNYLLSEYPLSPTENLEPVHLAPEFYLYRNLSAWPYYYFADRIETISSFEELYLAKKGVAYVQEKDIEMLSLGDRSRQGRELFSTKFKYDEIKFSTFANEKQFLVVADAWHPFWHAQIDGKETPVIKANGIFKGVSVPSGQHTVRFYFDNSAYQPGIWISVISWVLFLSGWGWRAFRLRWPNRDVN
jgi:hypothetical protein